MAKHKTKQDKCKLAVHSRVTLMNGGWKQNQNLRDITVSRYGLSPQMHIYILEYVTKFGKTPDRTSVKLDSGCRVNSFNFHYAGHHQDKCLSETGALKSFQTFPFCNGFCHRKKQVHSSTIDRNTSSLVSLASFKAHPKG